MKRSPPPRATPTFSNIFRRSEYVGYCRKMSEIVGKCWKLSENVGKCRGGWGWGGPKLQMSKLFDWHQVLFKIITIALKFLTYFLFQQ